METTRQSVTVVRVVHRGESLSENHSCPSGNCFWKRSHCRQQCNPKIWNPLAVLPFGLPASLNSLPPLDLLTRTEILMVCCSFYRKRNHVRVAFSPRQPMECTVAVERKMGMRRMRAAQCIQPACISQQARGIVRMSVAPSARVSPRPCFFPEQHPIDSSEASNEVFPAICPLACTTPS